MLPSTSPRSAAVSLLVLASTSIALTSSGASSVYWRTKHTNLLCSPITIISFVQPNQQRLTLHVRHTLLGLTENASLFSSQAFDILIVGAQDIINFSDIRLNNSVVFYTQVEEQQESRWLLGEDSEAPLHLARVIC